MANKAHEEKTKEDDKEIQIKVNGTWKEVIEKVMSFFEIVSLAFPGTSEQDNVATTVTYYDKHGDLDGSLVSGETIKIKKGMQFNVSRTNLS